MTERTTSEILGAEAITVTLGGRAFEVRPQKRKNSRRFRHQCRERLTSLQDVIVAGIKAASGSFDPAEIVPRIAEFIGGPLDEVIDLIYEYDPVLSDARDHIDENATDSECIDALIACFMLAFGPFVQLPARIEKMQTPKDSTPETPTPS